MTPDSKRQMFAQFQKDQSFEGGKRLEKNKIT